MSESFSHLVGVLVVCLDYTKTSMNMSRNVDNSSCLNICYLKNIKLMLCLKKIDYRPALQVNYWNFYNLEKLCVKILSFI
jgi:hypothetical protein